MDCERIFLPIFSSKQQLPIETWWVQLFGRIDCGTRERLEKNAVAIDHFFGCHQLCWPFFRRPLTQVDFFNSYWYVSTIWAFWLKEFEVTVELGDKFRSQGNPSSQSFSTKFLCHSDVYIGLCFMNWSIFVTYGLGLKRNNVVAKIGEFLSMNIAIVDPTGVFLPHKDVLIDLYFIQRDGSNEILKEDSIEVCIVFSMSHLFL